MSDNQIPSLVSGLIVIDEQRWFIRLAPELLFWKTELDDLQELHQARDLLGAAFGDVLDNWVGHARDLLNTKREVLSRTPNPELAKRVLIAPMATREDAEEYLRAIVDVGEALVELRDAQYFLRLEGRVAQLLVGERLREYAELGSYVPVSVLSPDQLEGVVAKYT